MHNPQQILHLGERVAGWDVCMDGDDDRQSVSRCVLCLRVWRFGWRLRIPQEGHWRRSTEVLRD